MKTALSVVVMTGALAVFAWHGPGWAQAPKPSQHGTVSQQIANTTITIAYNRPVARGREIFGKLVPWGRVWCPGADTCTSIELSTSVQINGEALAAGGYSIWVEPEAEKWTVIFNRANPVFHTRHPADQDALRVPATPRQGSHMETLAFYFPVVDGKHAELVLHWGTVVVPLSIDVPLIAVEVLRLYDPDRRPASWTEIVRPGQFVAFSKHIDTGGPCDESGRPFASSAEIACLVFDRFEEARGFCEERVVHAPPVRFDIYDSAGRTNPPLLTVVHPSRVATLDGNPRGARLRKHGAIALTVGAVALFWFDYWKSEGMLILPTILGINMILIAARLIQLNASHAHAERERLARLAQAASADHRAE